MQGIHRKTAQEDQVRWDCIQEERILGWANNAEEEVSWAVNHLTKRKVQEIIQISEKYLKGGWQGNKIITPPPRHQITKEKKSSMVTYDAWMQWMDSGQKAEKDWLLSYNGEEIALCFLIIKINIQY